MTVKSDVSEADALRRDLRPLKTAHAIGLPEYKNDPVVGRRIGRMLAEAATRIALAATRR